ncbi:MAG TPA: fasciclin domain-containing protein [Allosphingosinicella sp.]|nr:fasciclin domain-containing protein [Allosphingosinicella sp.]
MNHLRIGIAAAAAAVLLSGCNRAADTGNAAANETAPAANAVEPGSQTVAAALAGDGDLGRLGEIAANAGLAELLGGTGPFTLFAPDNSAFPALGAGADALKTEAMRPQAIALLRAHIVPGVVTRRDLDAALARGGSRPTQMRTMSGGTLTFTRDGDAVVVTSDTGGHGRLVEETLASNGAIERVDGLLVPAEAPAR